MKAFVTGLTLAAILASSASVFAAADDKGEKKGEKKDRDPAQVFKKLDANSDGQLSFDEFKGKREEARARKAFDRMDANKDGVLKSDEFKLPERKKKDA
jgi:Ca2+-binding EF-hand superfamily protein